jgi:hypothetical protein
LDSKEEDEGFVKPTLKIQVVWNNSILGVRF